MQPAYTPIVLPCAKALPIDAGGGDFGLVSFIGQHTRALN